MILYCLPPLSTETIVFGLGIVSIVLFCHMMESK